MRRPAEKHLKVRPGEWLRQIVPGAATQSFHARRDARIASHHEDDRAWTNREDGLENLHPGNGRHVQVDHDDVVRGASNHVERLVAASAGRDIVALDLKNAGTTFTERTVVVDDQDPD